MRPPLGGGGFHRLARDSPATALCFASSTDSAQRATLGAGAKDSRMTATRIIADELLDGLAEDDPAARRSRRDLRRIHLAMGTRSILLREWRKLVSIQDESKPAQVLEIGAGDGTLMLGVAQRLGVNRQPVDLTL